MRTKTDRDRHNKILDNIAESLDVPRETVEAVIDFQFKDLRESIREGSIENLYMWELGTLSIRRRRLESHIGKWKELVAKVKEGTPPGGREYTPERIEGLKKRINTAEEKIKTFYKNNENKSYYRRLAQSFNPSKGHKGADNSGIGGEASNM